MAYYDNDAVLQELHDEMYRAEEERPKQGFSMLDQKVKFGILIFAGLLIVMVYFEKVTTSQAFIIGGVIAGIVALMSTTSPPKKELTMVECLIRCNDLLKFLQDHPIGDYPQIPRGYVRVKPIGKKQWFQGQGFKRSFAVDIYDDDCDITEMYFAEIDIYTGDLITFKHAPEGVTGDEKKDVVLLPTPDMLMQKRRDQYMGKAYSYRR